MVVSSPSTTALRLSRAASGSALGRTYAHVFSEFARGERIDPNQAVAAARDAGLPSRD
jgi:hypothetical protein